MFIYILFVYNKTNYLQMISHFRITHLMICLGLGSLRYFWASCLVMVFHKNKIQMSFWCAVSIWYHITSQKVFWFYTMYPMPWGVCLWRWNRKFTKLTSIELIIQWRVTIAISYVVNNLKNIHLSSKLLD